MIKVYLNGTVYYRMACGCHVNPLVVAWQGTAGHHHKVISG